MTSSLSIRDHQQPSRVPSIVPSARSSASRDRTRSITRSTTRSIAASLAALALSAGLTMVAACGTEVAGQDQSLGDPGTGGGGDPGTGGCGAIFDGSCVAKDEAGHEVACQGEELTKWKQEQQRAFDSCVQAERCVKTVLDPAMAACPAKTAPGAQACFDRAMSAYAACLGAADPGTGGPGTGR